MPIINIRRFGLLILGIAIASTAFALISAHRKSVSDATSASPAKPSNLNAQTQTTVNNATAPAGIPAQQPSVASGVQNEAIPAELITVRPTGFDPAEIQRPAGPFVLIIENRSGRDLNPLRLENVDSGLSVASSRFEQAHVKREVLTYGERLDLQPGVYRLRENGKGGMACTIKITAR